MILCDLGCGKEAKFFYKNGRKCCSEYSSQCKKKKEEYHLDHKLSVNDGYETKIDSKVIGHYKNLRIIPSIENTRKNRKSSISLQELIVEIREG